MEQYARVVGAKTKEVSAKENIGIDEVFNEIAEEIGKKSNYQSINPGRSNNNSFSDSKCFSTSFKNKVNNGSTKIDVSSANKLEGHLSPTVTHVKSDSFKLERDGVTRASLRRSSEKSKKGGCAC